jgi:PTH1 family peptidyl-tRNA hydrolase
MSLFQRRPQTSDPVNYVTVGLNKTVLIVGLGNPGKEYDGTRHNIGFDAVDDFVARNDDMGAWVNKKDMKCLMSMGQLGQSRVIVIKPTTFMNNSGEAVQAVVHFYKITLEQIAVVHDELDIPFGQIRMRTGGSSAGHNGIKSVTQHLEEGYGRVRIGVGPKKPAAMDSADFVLAKFSKAQMAEMPALKREVSAILGEFAFGMNLPTETRSFLI